MLGLIPTNPTPETTTALMKMRRNTLAGDDRHPGGPVPFPNPRNHCEEIANARAAVDDDPIERIEGLTQHACDELAETNVRMATLEERTAEILSHLKGAAA